MWIPRTAAVNMVVSFALLAAVLAVPASADVPSDAHGDPSSAAQVVERHDGDLLRSDARALAGPLPGLTKADGTPTGAFIGSDGVTYDEAPGAVSGRHGTVYFGPEFDLACHWGRDFDRALHRLAKFAATIRRSGRKVLFTVAPNKSSVNKRDLPLSLPHGRCAGQGIHAEDLALDQFQHSAYVPLRKTLAQDAEARREVYWHLDTHWTSVGATELAAAVADRLDPTVASRQSLPQGQADHLRRPEQPGADAGRVRDGARPDPDHAGQGPTCTRQLPLRHADRQPDSRLADPAGPTDGGRPDASPGRLVHVPRPAQPDAAVPPG